MVEGFKDLKETLEMKINSLETEGLIKLALPAQKEEEEKSRCSYPVHCVCPLYYY